MCAQVELDAGREAAAHAALEEVARRAGAAGDPTYTNDALMTLAQLDMDNERWGAARERLQRAVHGFAGAGEQTGEAQGLAMLALCSQALGNVAERDRAAGRARELRQAINSRQEVFSVDVGLAQLEGQVHSDAAAVSTLLALATDAERRRWLGWMLEAKLAAWELSRVRDAGAAEALHVEIEKTAREHGFIRILNLLRRRDGESVRLRTH